MWKTKVWIEGDLIDFTSAKEDQEAAEDNILDQTFAYFEENYDHLDIEEAMFFIEELERV